MKNAGTSKGGEEGRQAGNLRSYGFGGATLARTPISTRSAKAREDKERRGKSGSGAENQMVNQMEKQQVRERHEGEEKSGEESGPETQVENRISGESRNVTTAEELGKDGKENENKSENEEDEVEMVEKEKERNKGGGNLEQERDKDNEGIINNKEGEQESVVKMGGQSGQKEPVKENMLGFIHVINRMKEEISELRKEVKKESQRIEDKIEERVMLRLSQMVIQLEAQGEQEADRAREIGEKVGELKAEARKAWSRECERCRKREQMEDAEKLRTGHRGVGKDEEEVRKNGERLNQLREEIKEIEDKERQLKVCKERAIEATRDIVKKLTTRSSRQEEEEIKEDEESGKSRGKVKGITGITEAEIRTEKGERGKEKEEIKGYNKMGGIRKPRRLRNDEVKKEMLERERKLTSSNIVIAYNPKTWKDEGTAIREIEKRTGAKLQNMDMQRLGNDKILIKTGGWKEKLAILQIKGELKEAGINIESEYTRRTMEIQRWLMFLNHEERERGNDPRLIVRQLKIRLRGIWLRWNEMTGDLETCKEWNA